MVDKLVLHPFLNKLKLSIYLDQLSKVLYSLFLLYGKLRAIEWRVTVYDVIFGELRFLDINAT